MDVSQPAPNGRNKVESSWHDGEFLTLRQLTKEGKVKLSEPLTNMSQWTGRLRLLAVSSKTGWFAAGRDTSVIIGTLKELYDTFMTHKTTFEPRYALALSSKPTHITFACNDEKIIVCQLGGSISIYDTGSLVGGSDRNQTLAPSNVLSHATDAIRDIQPNPSDRPELLAVMRGLEGQQSRVEMIDVRAGVVVGGWGGQTSLQFQTSMSWSRKGKQIVVGNVNGDLIQYTPEGEPKATLARPSQYEQPWSVTSVIWLENTVFHVTYTESLLSPDDPLNNESWTIINDPKNGNLLDIEIMDPAPPFGDRSRETGKFYSHLPGWEPTKHILLVGDAPSTDIGIVACFSEQNSDMASPWGPLELEDTSRATLPTDEEGNDTYPVGVDVDLSSTEPVNMSTQGGDDTPPLPPSPILYVYTNAGLILAYHVLNSKHPQYPHMVQSSTSAPAPPSQTSSFGNMDASLPTPSTTPAPKTGFLFGGATTTSAFGSTTSPFAASATPSLFGGAKPAAAAFGQSGFGQSGFGAAPSAFGRPAAPAPVAPVASAFSGFATPAATSSAGGTGFSAFSGQKSVFAAVPTSPASSSPFGGGQTSIFGQTPAPKVSTSTSPFTASTTTPNASPVKPGIGFAAFASQPPVTPAGPPPTSVFGGFGTQSTTPAFAPSKPTSVFGSGGFGQATTSTSSLPSSLPAKPEVTPPPKITTAPVTSTPQGPPPTGSTSGGFISKGFGAFGASKPATPFGATASSPTTPPTTAPATSTTPKASPMFGAPSAIGTSVGGKPTFGAPSAFGNTNTFGAAKPPVTVVPPSAGGGFAGFSSSSSGFAAFAAPKLAATSSFDNLLKGDKGDKTLPAAPSTTSIAKTPFEKKPGDIFAARPRGSGLDDDDDDEKEGPPKERFPEAKIANVEPTTTSDTLDIFGAPSSKAKFAAATGTAGLSLGGFSLNDSSANDKASQGASPSASPTIGAPSPVSQPPPAPEAKPTKQEPSPLPSPKIVTTPPAAPSNAPPPQFGLSSPVSPHAPAKEAPPRSGTTTPPGSPAKVATPPKPEPASSSSPQGQASSSTTPTSLGLGRPSSMPPRQFGSGGTTFSSVPSRSSPLGSTPPVSREDLGISPPKAPLKRSGGVFRKQSADDPSDEEDDDDAVRKLAQDFSKPRSVEKKMEKPNFSFPVKSSPPSTTGLQSSQPFNFGFANASKAPQPAPSLNFGAQKAGARPPTPPLKSFFSAPPKPAQPSPPLASSSANSATTPPGKPTPAFQTPTPGGFAGFGKPLGAAPSQSIQPAPSFSFGARPPAVPFNTPSQPVSFTPKAPPPTSSAPLGVASAPSMPAKPTVPAPPPNTSGVGGGIDATIYIMERELDQLRNITKQWGEHHARIAQGHDIRNNPNFSVPSGWSMGDLKALRRCTNALEDDTLTLKDQSLSYKAKVTELQGLLLKAETKQEETARFIRAREDPDFARIIKVRHLGPEHEENQARLRKSIQMVQDRAQQMEDHITALKKQVAQAKGGASALKAPTLDVISRTINNIQMGTLQQSAKLHDLTARIDKIQLSPSPSPPGSPSPATGRQEKARTRDGTPLHEILARSSITPRVTSASAAALNAERCAARLKTALLQARKQPLKNTSALLKPADTDFAAELTFLPAPVILEPPLPPQTKIPEGSKEFFPSNDTFSVIPSGVPRDRKASGSMRSKRSHHSTAPTAKAAVPNPAAQTFDFGPLPARSQPVRNELSFSLAPPPRASPSPSPSLSNFVPLSAPTNFVPLSKPANFVPLAKPTNFVPLSASPSFALPSASPSFATLSPSSSFVAPSTPSNFFSFSKPAPSAIAQPPPTNGEEEEDDEFDDGEEDGDLDDDEDDEGEEGEDDEEEEDGDDGEGEGEDEEWDHVQTR